jgi:hypothetical protein
VADNIKRIARTHFGTSTRELNNVQEHGTKIRIRNIAKVLRRIDTLQEQSRETFLHRKTQKRYENLIKRLPRYLQHSRARLDTPQGRTWVKMIKDEKRTKLTKLHTDRKIKSRKGRTRQNAQDEALQAKRRDTHENISSVPEEIEGKTVLTTNPVKVRKAVSTYFQSHLGQRGPKEQEMPAWLKEELSKQRYEDTYSLDKPFTNQELRKSLANSKNSAAPGKDGIPTAALKFAILHAPEETPNHALSLLLTITQAIYDAEGKHRITKAIVCKPLYKKQGIKDLTNLRPIALQNSIAKLPSKMLAARLANDLFQNGAIHSANEGFLRGRNTGNSLTTILNIWEDAKAKNKSCYCVSYDQSKAYDHLRWFTIKHGMQRLNLPLKFQNYVLGKMEGSTIEFKTHYGNTEPFTIKRGTAQGCPLSPLIYIISMDLLHAGLHDNPIHNNEDGSPYQDGYKMNENSKPIADKCYADDTLLLSGSKKGITRMNDWVNAFCKYNYITMNEDKTKIFGLDENRKDIELSLKVIQQTPEGPIMTDAHSQSAAVHIKHLGLWMNMHLDWSRAISDLSSTIGWHRHIISANSLSTEAATYLINTVLTPKLEYRLRFFLTPDKILKQWDTDISTTLNNTYNPRCRTNRQALTSIARLTLPTKVQNLASITHLQRTVVEADHSDAGRTTRARLNTSPYPLNKTDMHVNWNKQSRNRASKAFNLEMIQSAATPPPSHWENHRDNPASKNQITAKVQGQNITLPTHFYGTWGNSSPTREVAVYTDGSRKEEKNEKPTGSWAAILHDDLYEENWEKLHESEGRKPREDLIKELGIPYWYGAIPSPRSSYNTELEAITRIAMILPSSWNVTVWTDSKSTIDRIEALRTKDPIRIMNEPEWQLLSLFMHIETLRTKPLVLRHVRSHTKQKDPISVGNATADLKADHARLWGKLDTIPRLPIHSYMCFRKYTVKGQPPYSPLPTFRDLRTYITTKMDEESDKPWRESNSQSTFLHNTHEPEQMLKYFVKELKGKHTGTLIDTLTTTITRPSYISPEDIHCLYCKHVRKDHRIRPLTPEHLSQCLVNPHGKQSLLATIKEEITTSWEPEWSIQTETPDTTLKIAHRLVNHLQTKKKYNKLQIKTEAAGWIGQIWPSDLDKLAIQFVIHRTKNKLTIDQHTWRRALTKFLRQVDCTCPKSKCNDTCKHQMDWSPPDHIQFLASTLIDATTIRYANILQKSPCLQHVVNKHGADRMWGSSHPETCAQNNFVYSPPNNDQLGALREAQDLKSKSMIDKTLGAVFLDKETMDEIEQSNLTLIATIPPRGVHIHPHPSTRIPKQKGTTHLPIGLVLGISPAAKIVDNTEVLIAIHTLRNWQKKHCPTAQLHEENFVRELANQPSSNFFLQEGDWHKAILEAWNWTTSPTGTQGIILKEDQAKVGRLKGSRKYNNQTKKVALQLFTFFAKEWEDKNEMLPTRARQWWYKYNDEAEAVPPATRLRNKRKRQEKQKHIFKECMEVMHNRHNKRHKNNQNSQHKNLIQDNQIPAPQKTPPVKKCQCGKDLLTKNDNTPMIQCDSCQTWLHLSCTSLEQYTDLPDTFSCQGCDTRALNAPRKRKRRKIAISMKIKSRIKNHQANPPTATWTCTTCTYELNNPEERACGICHAKRPKTKVPVKEIWWVGRVLPANALQKPNNPSQLEPLTHTPQASDVIARVQDKVKYSAQIPAIIRKTSNKRAKPSTSTQTSPPAPARPTYSQTTGPRAAKQTVQPPTNPLTNIALAPHPYTKAQCIQHKAPQKPRNKRKRQETRNKSIPLPSSPTLPTIQRIRKSSRISEKRKISASPASPRALSSLTRHPNKKSRRTKPQRHIKNAQQSTTQTSLYAHNPDLTTNKPPPSTPPPRHIPPEPPP